MHPGVVSCLMTRQAVKGISLSRSDAKSHIGDQSEERGCKRSDHNSPGLELFKESMIIQNDLESIFRFAENSVPSVSRREAFLQIAAGVGALSCAGQAGAAFNGPLGLGKRGASIGNWHALDLAATRYLSLPAQVNGRSFRAMIDTGASRSVLRHDLALDLDLPLIGSVVATTFSDSISGTLYRVDNLAIETAAFRHVDMASYDLSRVEGMLGREMPLILGQDVLRAIDLDVAFEQDRARFLSLRQPDEPDFQRIGLQGSDRKFPCLPIRLERHIGDHAILDLGSDVPLSMSRDFAEHFNLLEDRPVSTTLSYGADGPSVSQIMTVREARIGPFTLHDLPTCVVENWEFAEPLAIGWSALSRFEARVSLGRDLLCLRGEPTKVAMPFPKDRSGLGCQRLPDRFMVRHVALNSPAGKAGLNEGDQIVAIDGRPVSATYPAAGERLGLRDRGAHLDLALADGRSVRLVLDDYF